MFGNQPNQAPGQTTNQTNPSQGQQAPPMNFQNMFQNLQPPQAQPVSNPEVTYAEQLKKLEDMGFSNKSANIQVLQQTGGNVDMAVEKLLSMFQ